MSLTFATNITPVDELRVRLLLPHWLEVFGPYMGEMLIVADPRPPQGRFLAQHNHCIDEPKFHALLLELAQADPRVRIVEYSEELDTQIAAQWFKYFVPALSQDRLRILALAAPFFFAKHPTVIRFDCDMCFYEAGWVDAVRSALEAGEFDILDPCRGNRPCSPLEREVSMRVCALNMPHFTEKVLPIFPHTLDIFRCIHRLAMGKSIWLGLEQMLEIEKKRGRLRHDVLPPGLGWSFHLGIHENFLSPDIAKTVRQVSNGNYPDQVGTGWNFTPHPRSA